MSVLAYIKTDSLLASARSDNTVIIWNIKEGRLVHALKGHTKRVRALVYLGDGYLVSGSDDRTIKIWNVKEGELIETLEGHADWVEALVYIREMGFLVSCSGDKTIKIWDCLMGI